MSFSESTYQSQMDHYSKGESQSLIIISNSERCDKFGNKICENGNQKVTFKNPIKEIHNVENWKEFNSTVGAGLFCGKCSIF